MESCSSLAYFSPNSSLALFNGRTIWPPVPFQVQYFPNNNSIISNPSRFLCFLLSYCVFSLPAHSGRDEIGSALFVCECISLHESRKWTELCGLWYLFEQCDSSADWRVNGAGFHHSHQHGFGLLNAWRLVNAASVRAPFFFQLYLLKYIFYIIYSMSFLWFTGVGAGAVPGVLSERSH